VGEFGDLPLHGLDDPGRGVADGGDRDPGSQVDQPIAVDVLDDAPPARAAYTGMVVPTPRDTAPALRSMRAWEFGPGMVVARWRL
jgi:hypothetical protein